MECSYTRQVWNEIEVKLGLYNLWNGTTVTICLKNWVLKGELKHIRSMPIIMLWFIWKARNQCCFEDKVLSPYQVSSFYLGCLNSFPQDKIIRIRQVVDEVSDKTYPWGYFDGSAYEDPKICGAGVCFSYLMIIFIPSKLVWVLEQIIMLNLLD